ncbi:MAG: deoxyguanosinetriphosphate triphosphohydrolase family protein [Gaiellaceae bacterium]
MPYDAAAFERLAGPRAGSPDPSDHRSDFAHDRDRILYSSAFRRMAGKSQVVSVEELGLYHTRLTHSLKVSQLGRRLAERLQQMYLERRTRRPPRTEILPADPDLIEAACLAHDIGHAPFGHVGEAVLLEEFDRKLRRRITRRISEARLKEVGGFEGNAQTFRILTYLAARRPLAPRCGLNLTRATVDATIKYPRLRVHGGRFFTKWGAIKLDEERFRWARDTASLGSDASLCFEAQVMDWCDDVTFAVHDIVDFYRGGHIPLERLFVLGGSGTKRTLSEDARTFLRNTAAKRGWDLNEVEDAWRELAPMAEVYEPWQATLSIKAATQVITSQLITYLVAGIDYDGSAPCRYDARFLVDKDPNMAKRKRLVCDLLKELLWFYVIDRPAMASQQHGQARMVRDLLSVVYANADELLPPDRQQDLEEHGDTATDYVASLTERDAEILFHRLTGVRLGALTDVLHT